jgi:hypothetical protein
MNCLHFHELLDAGEAASLLREDHEARTHAGSCEGCRRALDQAIALEAALAAAPADDLVAASPDFTDRLMARVEVMPQARLAPADLARSMAAAFATPPVATSALAAAVLIGLAASAGFDPRRISAATTAAAAPLARLVEEISRPLPAAGLAHDVAVTGMLLAGLPLLAVFLGAAWQVGNLIGERTPRTL